MVSHWTCVSQGHHRTNLQSHIFLHNEERWEFGGGAVAGGSVPAVLFTWTMGGFPEPDTLGTAAVAGHLSWELAPTSLPLAFQRSTTSCSPAAAGRHPASLLPTLSSQWVSGPRTDGQFVFGWFLVTLLPAASVHWSNAERSRTVADWLHGGMCYRLCCQGDGMFCCFSPREGHKRSVMSSWEYLRASTSPCGLLFVCTRNTTISSARKCGLWTSYQSVFLCT